MSKEQNTPQYIKQVPWYAQDQNGEGELIKIPQMDPKGYLTDWYDRGKRGYQASAYRKGACENCGAMGHNKKQCTERPRKVKALFTNKNIASDDIVREIKTDWEVKRDRWNGFTPEMYKEVIDEYSKYEQIRKKFKGNVDEDDPHQEFKITKDLLQASNLPQKFKKDQRFQGIGNIRHRQDVAKYLRDLGEKAPHYDSKSRTLQGEDIYANELNNLEALGEKYDLTQQQRFAFDQVEKHNAELNSTALPTLTERIYKNVKEKVKGVNIGKMGQIISKYGAQDPRFNPLDVIQQEAYQHFTTNPIKKYTNKSRYQQDILNNDHNSVWGSWYNKYLGWGYSCCYSNDKLSYCLGKKGKQKALKKEFQMKTQQLKQLQQLEQLAKEEVQSN